MQKVVLQFEGVGYADGDGFYDGFDSFRAVCGKKISQFTIYYTGVDNTMPGYAYATHDIEGSNVTLVYYRERSPSYVLVLTKDKPEVKHKDERRQHSGVEVLPEPELLPEPKA